MRIQCIYYTYTNILIRFNHHYDYSPKEEYLYNIIYNNINI
jgi:hypothetical protein